MSSRVLIVEPYAWLREIEGRALEKMGFTVDETSSVGSAILAVKANLPNVLVTRWLLRDGTAAELIAQLDRLEIKIPLVGIAGREESARLLIEIGAAVVLLQPFGAKELEVGVRTALEGS